MSLNLRLYNNWEDILYIKDFYESIGGKTDNLLSVAVAYDDDKIVGFLSMQYLTHVGQLWVDPKYRRRGIAKQLGLMFETLPFETGESYLMFPSNDASEAVAKSLGLEKMDWTVYKRTF